MRRARSLSIGLLLAGPFYLLLIDTFSAPELYAGAGAALIAAVAYELAYAQGLSGDPAFRAAWLSRACRVPAQVPPQIAILCVEAARQAISPRRARGRLRAAPFDAGSSNDAVALGRRAITEAVGSLTPNTIVIGIDPDAELLLVHQLRVGGGADQLDQLRLG